MVENSHSKGSSSRNISLSSKSLSSTAVTSSLASSSSEHTTVPVKSNSYNFSAFKLSVQSESIRCFGTLRTQYPGSLPDTSVDPYRLLEDDLKDIYHDIRTELIKNTNQEELQTIATYYFDGQGKALRPVVAILVARAINHHIFGDDRSNFSNVGSELTGNYNAQIVSLEGVRLTT
ncbi:hypothetical protein RUM44_005159 [Polyplax serrata]|uniref:Uncharacterized protein n=1 Tax=Polyplax serrata TaxID=468196 RepID=A0ABR1AE99_POLSC